MSIGVGRPGTPRLPTTPRERSSSAWKGRRSLQPTAETSCARPDRGYLDEFVRRGVTNHWLSVARAICSRSPCSGLKASVDPPRSTGAGSPFSGSKLAQWSTCTGLQGVSSSYDRRGDDSSSIHIRTLLPLEGNLPVATTECARQSGAILICRANEHCRSLGRLLGAGRRRSGRIRAGGRG